MAPPERAGIYGFFIKLLSFGFSLRLTLIVQTLMCSYLLRLLMLRVFSIHTIGYRLFVVSILSIGSSLSWTASMLMPDLFCAISVLSLLCIVLLFRHLQKSELIILLVVSLVSSVFHASIFLVNALFVALFTLLLLISGKFSNYFRPLLLASFITIAGYVSIGSIHKLVNGEFFISKSANAFIVARLSETGILSNYLAEKCAVNSNPLCAFKRSFPLNAEYFLWNEKSPIHQVGGIHDTLGVLGTITAEVLSSPKFVLQFAYAGVKSGIQQLFLFEVGNGLTAGYLYQLKYAGNIAFADAAAARQTMGIPFERFNMLHYFMLFILLALFLYQQPHKALGETVWYFAAGILCILLANAFVNGAFSTPLHRYQARVIWLIAFWLLAVQYPPWRNRQDKGKLNRQNETGNSNSGAE